MRDCPKADVRDLLPDLVHGRLNEIERVAVEAHLTDCVACAGEVEVIRRTAAMLALGTPRIDVSRVAAAVESRVSTGGSRPALSWSVSLRRPGGRRVLQLAAAAVIAVIGVTLLQFMGGHGGDADIAARSSPGAIIEADVPSAVARPGLALVGGIDALTTDELAVLVASVESLDPLGATDAELIRLVGAEEVW
jgi:anti-sigma factor RsiW